MILFLTLLSIIMLIFILVFTIYFISKQSKKRSELLKELKEAGILKSFSKGEGKIGDIKYKIYYFGGSKNSQPYFSISLSGDIPVKSKGFYLTKETSFDRFFKKLGLVSEIQTGDEEFDNLFFINSSDDIFTKMFLSNPKNRDLIKEIYKLGYNQIFIQNKKIEVRAKPVSKDIKADKASVEFIAQSLAELSEYQPKNNTIVVEEDTNKIGRYSVYFLTIFLFIFGIITFVFAYSKYKPLDMAQLMTKSLIYYFVGSLVFGWFSLKNLKGRSNSHYEWLTAMIISLISIFFLSSGIMMYINGHYDKSAPKNVETVVLKKYYVRGKNGSSYYFILKSWRDNSEFEKIKVSRGIFKKIDTKKDLIRVSTKSGKLGYEWITDWHLIKND